ncbi:MAG: thioredoxin family protein [Fibrobacterota bacterium]
MKYSGMKIVIFVLFIIAAGIILLRKTSQEPAETPVQAAVSQENAPQRETDDTPVMLRNTRAIGKPTTLPRFLELGSQNCVPCKMMVPVLDTLRNRYSEELSIEFIDVMEDRETAQKYGVRAIPTQVILDETGEEVFRHRGYWDTDAIEEKLRSLAILEEKE